MRISLNWLRELVDFDLEPEDLAQRLTLAGFEVEDIEDRRTWAEGVVLGKVLVREPHPNADKLSVCQVDIGADQPSTIVCGAANVAAGLWVPVATVGSFLPQVGEAGIKIRPAKLRGVLSEGMICSLAELGLAKESAGIHSFAAQIAPVGSDIRPLLGLDDVIFDLSSTANRADVLSMVGVAREVAALTGGKLHLPEVIAPTLPPAPSLKIAIDDNQTCPAYLGTLVEHVTIAPSPQWLQSKLESAGVRPINNVVDITNYILLTWGQPLHAFDQDRLKTVAGGKALTIGVRLAKTGETLTTLDDQERSLQAQNLLITANDQPVALAGVMGGESTEVSDTTQNLLLEAALFSSIAVRRSGRAQGLRTEASTRYERGVNIAELEIACNHALQLLQELAGGKIVAQAVADSRNTQPRSIELRLERLQQVLGPVMPDLETEVESDLDDEFTGEFPGDAVPVCLTALGFGLTETESGQVWQVTVPPHRYRDIEREIDLIEEVARLYGYDNFAETLPAKTEYGYLPLDQTLTRQLREALRGAGLTELCHYTWTKPNPEDNSGGQISVVNPLLVEFSALRTELLTGLLQAYQYNREQGNGALNGFEIGRIFGEDEDGLYEMDILAGIISGDPAQGRWLRHSLQDQPLTWYEAKGMLTGVFERLSLTVEFQPDSRNPRFHPGRTASLWVAGERLGTFGQIHPQLCQSLDLPAEIYLFQWDLEVVLASIEQAQAEQGIFKPFSTYPALDRDLAFFAGTQISVAELERTIWKAAGSSHSLLAGVELFDEYRGDSVPAGQRSLAFRLTYRMPDRTLTDAEVNPIQQQIRDALTEKYQVSLRS